MTDLNERAERPKKTKKAPTHKPAARTAPPAHKDPDVHQTAPRPPAQNPLDAIQSSPPAETHLPASLLEHLGGVDSVCRLADQLAMQLMADPRINHALFGTARSELHNKLHKLLERALEAGQGELQPLFSPLIERGFKDGQFTHLLTHLRSCLSSLELPGEVIEQLTLATQKLRPELFSR